MVVMLVLAAVLVVLGGKGRIALSRDVANVVDCGGVEATLGGVNDEGSIFLVERSTQRSTQNGAG